MGKSILARITEKDIPKDKQTGKVNKGRPTRTVPRFKPDTAPIVEHIARVENDSTKHGDFKDFRVSVPFPLARALDVMVAQRRSNRNEVFRQMLRLYLAQYCEEAVIQALHEATLDAWPNKGAGLHSPSDPKKIEFSKQAEQYRHLITSYNFQYRMFRNHDGAPVLIAGDEIYNLERYSSLSEEDRSALLKKIVSDEVYERAAIGRGW